MAALDLTGPAGRLEALLEDAPGARFAALVCHPHPQMGGTLHNHATYRLAKAVRAAGGTALRFNYRGVGRSAGRWAGGQGEADDARAVLRWLAAERPDVPLLACGFSFGAWMAALVARDEARVRGLLLAGVALHGADDLPGLRDAARLRELERPVAVVQADGDQFGAPDEVRAALDGSRGPRRLAVVPGATHLFGEALPVLQREAEAALAWLLAGGAPA